MQKILASLKLFQQLVFWNISSRSVALCKPFLLMILQVQLLNQLKPPSFASVTKVSFGHRLKGSHTHKVVLLAQEEKIVDRTLKVVHRMIGTSIRYEETLLDFQSTIVVAVA